MTKSSLLYRKILLVAVGIVTRAMYSNNTDCNKPVIFSVLYYGDTYIVIAATVVAD